jgi:tRNA pseudouridine55 synthase
VTVHSFDVDAGDDPLVFRIRVTCSSGTYVRTIAADLGRLLGGGAHLRSLRRVESGSFGESEARPPDEADLLAPAEAVRDYESVAVDDAAVDAIGHGRRLAADPMQWQGDGPWAVLDPRGELVAMYERADATTVRPLVVLAGR